MDLLYAYQAMPVSYRVTADKKSLYKSVTQARFVKYLARVCQPC